MREMEEEIRRLRMENEFLKKAAGLIRADATVAERCALIDAEEGLLLHRLDVPDARSGALVVLRLAQPGRDRDRSPAPGAEPAHDADF